MWQPTGTRPVPVVTVARRLDLVPTAAWGGTRWTRPDGRRRTAAGWTPDGRTPDGLDTGRAGHQTAGHRTAGPPDPDDGTAEWTPHGGRGRRPTPWQASWPCRPGRRTAAAPPGAGHRHPWVRLSSDSGMHEATKRLPAPLLAGVPGTERWRAREQLHWSSVGRRRSGFAKDRQRGGCRCLAAVAAAST
jgi:hypothetical protein